MRLMQLCATRTNCTRSVLLLLGMSLAFSVPAGGTTLIHMGTKDLTLKADAIFYGVCESVEQAWDIRKTKIYTKARYTVRDVVKGNLGAEVTVTALGGRVGGIAMMVPASPRFKTGQEAVLFLWQNSQGDYYVLGMVQGKKDVVTDPGNGGKYLHSGSLVAKHGQALEGTELEGKQLAAEGLVSLSSYLDEVRSYVSND